MPQKVVYQTSNYTKYIHVHVQGSTNTYKVYIAVSHHLVINPFEMFP